MNIEQKLNIVRRLMADIPSTVRSVYLSKTQIHLFDLVETNKGMTSAILAEVNCISAQNASGQLAKLYSKGYLKRDELIHESGGIEYRYTACV